MTLDKSREESLHILKMNYWLTTINMPRAWRPAYNTARSIRVFIMCGYWSLMKEWIIFHTAYVSGKKSSRGIGKPYQSTGCVEVKCWATNKNIGIKRDQVCRQYLLTSLSDECQWSFFQIHASLVPSCFLSCWIQSCWPFFLLAQINTSFFIVTLFFHWHLGRGPRGW